MIIIRLALLALAAHLVLLPTYGTATPNTLSAVVIVRVLDPLAGAIANARVMLYQRGSQTTFTTVTDRAGTAYFEHLPAGEYLVEADAQGFTSPGPPKLRIEADGVHELSITMTIRALKDHVTVTASGTPQRTDELSKAITVIDGEKLEARETVALGDVLRDVPGVRVEQFGGPGAFTSIRIRGLRPEDTAVLIDGVRFRDAGATQGDVTSFVSDLVDTDIDRIEVLRGAGSSLYGSNAVAGVVNLVTRAGGRPPSGSVLLEGGSLGWSRIRGQFAGGAQHDRLSYSVGIGHLHVGKGVDGDDQTRNTSLQGRMGLRLGEANLTFRMHGADAFTAVNEGPVGIGTPSQSGIVTATALSHSELDRYEAGVPLSSLAIGAANFIPSANDPDNSRNSRFLSTMLQLDHHPGGRLGYTVSYHRVATSRIFRDGPRGVSGFEPNGTTRSEFDGRIDTVAARGDFQLGSYQLVTTGYQFEHEQYLNDSIPVNPAAKASVDVTERSHSFFVQDQVSLLDGGLQISGSFRAQIFSLNTPHFMPTATAPYQGNPFEAPPHAYTADGSAAYVLQATQTKLRFHVGNGYRAPSLFERFGTSFGSRGYSIFGDPRLEPERSLAVDGGIDQELAAGRAQISVGGFSTRLKRVIIFDSSGIITPSTDPFGRSRGYRVVDGGTARGLELVTRVQPINWLRVSGSYTYTDAEPPVQTPTALPQAFGLPKHQFSVTLFQQIGVKFQASLDFIASSSYLAAISDRATFVSHTYRFTGIRRLDLSASYGWPVFSRVQLRLFGKFDNLTGQRYFESGFRTPGRSVRVGTVIEFLRRS